jgi:hypothetical protein
MVGLICNLREFLCGGGGGGGGGGRTDLHLKGVFISPFGQSRNLISSVDWQGFSVLHARMLCEIYI